MAVELVTRKVRDTAEQKGTGRWTGETALKLGVPVPAIAAAVDARSISSRRDDRALSARAFLGAPGAPVALHDAGTTWL